MATRRGCLLGGPGTANTPQLHAAHRCVRSGAGLLQRQIFQRSFTTKRGEGRGIGTHSIRRFTERYLRGNVSFTSTENESTVFSVSLPKR